MNHFKPMLSFLKEGTVNKTEIFQKQMHEFISECVKNKPNIEYQDAANTFLLLKIAELHEIAHTQILAEDTINNKI